MKKLLGYLTGFLIVLFPVVVFAQDAGALPPAADVMQAISGHDWLTLTVIGAQVLLLVAHNQVVNDWIGAQREWIKPLLVIAIALVAAIAIAVPTKSGLQVVLINWGTASITSLLTAYTVYFRQAGKVVVRPGISVIEAKEQILRSLTRDTDPTKPE